MIRNYIFLIVLSFLIPSCMNGMDNSNKGDEQKAPSQNRDFNNPIITVIDDDFNVNHVGKLKKVCDDLGIKCDFALIPFQNSYKVYFPEHQKALIDEYHADGFGFLLHPVHDCSTPYDLERLMVNFTVRSKDDIKQIIEEGVSRNAWIILGLHCWQFNESDELDLMTNSLGNLKEILEFASSKAEIMTFNEAIKQLTADK